MTGMIRMDKYVSKIQLYFKGELNDRSPPGSPGSMASPGSLVSGGDSDDMTSHHKKLNVIDSVEDGDDDVASKKKRNVVSKNSDDEDNDDELDDEDVSIRQMLHQHKILYWAA